MNIRILTSKDTNQLRGAELLDSIEEEGVNTSIELPERVLPEPKEPTFINSVPVVRNMTTPQPTQEPIQESTQEPIQQPTQQVQAIERSLGFIPAGQNVQGQPLATNPIIPNGSAPPANIVTAEDGTKVVNVDTSEAAMRSDGLTLENPPPIAEIPPVQAVQAPVPPQQVQNPFNSPQQVQNPFNSPPQMGGFENTPGNYTGNVVNDAIELQQNSYVTPQSNPSESVPQSSPPPNNTDEPQVTQGPIRVIKIG